MQKQNLHILQVTMEEYYRAPDPVNWPFEEDLCYSLAPLLIVSLSPPRLTPTVPHAPIKTIRVSVPLPRLTLCNIPFHVCSEK